MSDARHRRISGHEVAARLSVGPLRRDRDAYRALATDALRALDRIAGLLAPDDGMSRPDTEHVIEAWHTSVDALAKPEARALLEPRT